MWGYVARTRDCCDIIFCSTPPGTAIGALALAQFKLPAPILCIDSVTRRLDAALARLYSSSSYAFRSFSGADEIGEGMPCHAEGGKMAVSKSRGGQHTPPAGQEHADGRAAGPNSLKSRR